VSPFAKRKSASVAACGESALLEKIRRWLGPVSPPPPAGMGDDCALLPPSRKNLLITTDPVIYGRHFDDTVPPAAVGAKLLKRNLSDLAAMGARPTSAVLALTLDPRVSVHWMEQFYRGLAAAARRWRVRIVGGDLSQAENFIGAYLTLLGEPAGRRAVTRAGARSGDSIFVTGELGGSRLGHHWDFLPRLAEGAWLARRPVVRAMMDVSDGLAKDLFALAPAGTLPALDPAAVPVSAAARRLAAHTVQSPLQHALGDGEDYELVFALAAGTDEGAFTRAWDRAFPRTRLTRIGRFIPQKNFPPGALRLDRFHGYEHLQG